MPIATGTVLPPANYSHFPSLGGVCGGTVGRGRGGRGLGPHCSSSCRPRTRAHRSRSRGHEPSITTPVVEKAASWAEIWCSSKDKAWSPRALNFFKPVLKNVVKIAICPPEEMAKAAAHWDRVLMGYFVGLIPFVPALARYFKQLWRTKGDM